MSDTNQQVPLDTHHLLAEINPDRLQTLNQVVERACHQYASRPAFTGLGHTLSYAELERHANAFGAYLQHCGLKPGDRIAIQLPNLLQYPVVAIGAFKAGLVLVNTNPLYTPTEMRHQFQDSGAKALVILASGADNARQVIADTKIERVIITQLFDLHPSEQQQPLNANTLETLPNAIALNEALHIGANIRLAPHQASADDIAMLQYTGGTTGVAKGAMLSHGNLVANLLQLKHHLGDHLGQQAEIFVAPLPLYHIYAFNLHLLTLLDSGNHSLLIANPRDLDAFVSAIKPWPFTGFAGLNTLFVALANHPGFRALDFSNLHLTSSGGMALTQSTAEQWQSLTGCAITEGYGLTETSPTVTSNRPGEAQLGSIGYPLIATELKVIDINDDKLANGETGELCVRGPQVMQGYWQCPDATADVLSEQGWFRTGDLAVIEDDGRVRIVDRKKDMILVSGFNVYPAEIEDVVCQLPAVLECAAIGIPDAHRGESVSLYLVRGDERLTEAEVRDHCRQQLTGYKRPSSIHFCDELPKSNVGKVLRRALREAHPRADIDATTL